MTDVFVSYSRRDAEFVAGLVADLEARGKSAWIDVEGIEFGEVFPDAIREAITQADAFVFVVTPASVSSRFCETEVEYALSLSKRFVPVLREPVDDADLPEAIRVRSWVPYTPEASRDAATAQLVTALERDLEHVRAHTRWLIKAGEWDAAGRDHSLLLRGSELAAAQRWLAGVGPGAEPPATQLQQEYIYASQAASVRRQRLLLGSSLAVAVLSLGLLGFALIQRSDARRAQTTAEGEALTSDARLLGTQALTETNLDRSLLLAVAGLKLKDTVETRGDLLAVLQGNPAGFRFAHFSRAEISALAVSPDSRLLASGDAAGVVRFIDLRSWKQSAAAVQLNGPVSQGSAAFSPDGHTLALSTATAGSRSNLYLVDVTSRKATLVRSWPSIPAVAGPLRFTRLAFSPDGSRIAVAVATAGRSSPIPVGERLFLLEATSGRILWQRTYPLRPGQNEAQVAFTPGGTIVTSAQQGETLLWNAASGQIERRFPIGGPFAVSPGGRLAALALNSPNPADPSAALALLDLRSGKHRSLQGLPARAWIIALEFTPDGNSIVGASFEGAVRVWGVASGSIGQTFTGQPSGENLALTPGGDTVVTGAKNGSVEAWDVSGTQRLARAFQWPTPPDMTCPATPCFAINPQSTLMATDQTGGSVALISLRTHRLVATLPARNGPAAEAEAFFPDGRMLATGGSNGHVTIWDTHTRSVARTFRLPDPVWSVAVSPDAKLLAVQMQAKGQADSRIELREIASGRILFGRRVRHGRGGVSFSPDGRWVAALGCCASGSEIDVWEARSGKQRLSPRGDGNATSFAFSPDGVLLGAGTADGKVVLWKIGDGSPAGSPIPAANGAIDPISFSPDSRLVAASSVDQTVSVWDLRTHKRLGNSFPIEGGVVPVARFADNGDLVIDYLAHAAQWPTRVAAWERFACRAAGRDLTPAEWKDLLPDRPYRSVCPQPA